MKLTLTTNDGKKVAERDVPDNTILSDIICRNETIASKIWLEEDIAGKLEEMGFEPSQHNIGKVINSGYLKRLNDCTDEDWMIIEYAIDFANDCGNLI